jgi:hypothetical protein
VKATEENPTLLILDEHYSYTRNSYIINFAREHHVSVISLPPHSTHKMQSLDLSFMAPLTTFYAQEIEEWIRRNNSRVMTIYQVAELFGSAYLGAATGGSAANVFHKAGPSPRDRNMFREHDILSDETGLNKNSAFLIIDKD